MNYLDLTYLVACSKHSRRVFDYSRLMFQPGKPQVTNPNVTKVLQIVAYGSRLFSC